MLTRPLGVGETLFAKLGEKTSNSFVVVAMLSGLISRPRLTAALHQAAAAHPNLGARVVFKHETAYLEFGHGSAVPLDAVERSSPEHWQQVAEDKVNAHLDYRGDALWSATLVADARGGELILAFNHVLGDGRSAEVLLRQILEVYAGSLAPTAVAQSTAFETHYRRRLPSWRRSKDLFRLAADFASANRRQMHHLPPAVPRAFVQEAKTTIVPLVLSREETMLLETVCRHHHTTVHGAISAAVMLAVYEEAGIAAADVGISSPVDLRPRLDGRRETPQFSFFVAPIDTLAQMGPDTEFWALAKANVDDLKAQIERGRARFNTAMNHYLLRKYPSTEALLPAVRAKAKSAAMVTNLGRVALKSRYGDLRLGHFFHIVSCHSFARPYVVVAAATLHQVLRLTFTFSDAYTDEAAVRRIIAGIMKRLQDPLASERWAV